MVVGVPEAEVGGLYPFDRHVGGDEKSVDNGHVVDARFIGPMQRANAGNGRIEAEGPALGNRLAGEIVDPREIFRLGVVRERGAGEPHVPVTAHHHVRAASVLGQRQLQQRRHLLRPDRSAVVERGEVDVHDHPLAAIRERNPGDEGAVVLLEHAEAKTWLLWQGVSRALRGGNACQSHHPVRNLEQCGQQRRGKVVPGGGAVAAQPSQHSRCDVDAPGDEARTCHLLQEDEIGIQVRQGLADRVYRGDDAPAIQGPDAASAVRDKVRPGPERSVTDVPCDNLQGVASHARRGRSGERDAAVARRLPSIRQEDNDGRDDQQEQQDRHGLCHEGVRPARLRMPVAACCTTPTMMTRKTASESSTLMNPVTEPAAFTS